MIGSVVKVVISLKEFNVLQYPLSKMNYEQALEIDFAGHRKSLSI
jgi:hypothetical protein